VHPRKILRKITGLSTPFFGLSWHLGIDEQDQLKELVFFLEDRRVLYNRFDNEVAHFVVLSVQELREELLKTLQKLSYRSKSLPHIRGMQAECRRFLDDTSRSVKFISELEGTFGGLGGDVKTRSWDHYKETINFYTALGSFRRGVGEHFVKLCEMYEIESPLLEHFRAPIQSPETADS
jgi:hypothetical protein